MSSSQQRQHVAVMLHIAMDSTPIEPSLSTLRERLHDIAVERSQIRTTVEARIEAAGAKFKMDLANEANQLLLRKSQLSVTVAVIVEQTKVHEHGLLEKAHIVAEFNEMLVIEDRVKDAIEDLKDADVAHELADRRRNKAKRNDTLSQSDDAEVERSLREKVGFQNAVEQLTSCKKLPT
jgi:hypothetical protein